MKKIERLITYLLIFTLVGLVGSIQDDWWPRVAWWVPMLLAAACVIVANLLVAPAMRMVKREVGVLTTATKPKLHPGQAVEFQEGTWIVTTISSGSGGLRVELQDRTHFMLDRHFTL